MCLSLIIAAAQNPLKPTIKDDKKIARTHFLDAQLGGTLLSVLP
jgi:hypothetical protein